MTFFPIILPTNAAPRKNLTRREKKIRKIEDEIEKKNRAIRALPNCEMGLGFILQGEVAELEEQLKELTK